MIEYNNELRGALFKNERKDHENHPDYKGNITIEGKGYWLAAWINESKDGMKYFAIRATLKENQNGRSAKKPKSETFGSSDKDFNDEIPF